MLSMNMGFKAWVMSALLTCSVVLGLVALYDTTSSVRLARAGGQVVGYGAGSTAAGITEVPTAFRVTYNDTGTANKVPGATGGQTASQHTASENAALKRKLAEQEKAIKALQKAQKNQ